MNGKPGKYRLLVFDGICAAAVFVLTYAQIQTQIAGRIPLTVIIFIGLMTGIFLSSKLQSFGFLFPALALLLSAFTLPLVVMGVVIAGDQIWIVISASLVALIVGMLLFRMLRALAMTVIVFATVAVLLIPLVISGRVGEGCATETPVIDQAGGRIVNSNDIHELACSPDAGKILAAHRDIARISQYDIESGMEASHDLTLGKITQISANGSLLLAADQTGANFSLIDSTQLTQLQEIALPDTGCDPADLVLTELYSRSLLYCRDTGTMIFIDTLDGQKINETERFARLPYSVRENRAMQRVYATDLLGRDVAELDIETNGVLRRFQTNMSQSDVAVAEDGLTLYLGRPAASQIDVYDAVNLEEIDKFTAPFGVSKLAIDHENNRLFMAAFSSGIMAMVDLNDGYRTQWYDLQAQVRDMIYCPESGLLFFATPCEVFFLNPDLLQ